MRHLIFFQTDKSGKGKPKIVPTYLNNSKSKVDNLDIHKLKTISDNLKKISGNVDSDIKQY